MRIFRTLAIAALVLGPLPALAEYPDKPVKLIVPFAPGGVADILARVVGQKVTEQTGKVIIVENRTGAGGRIGYDAGAKSRPDGYTFVVTDVTYTMLPALYDNLPWNPADLVPVTLLGQMPFVVAVNAKTKMTSLPDLIAYAKANPKQLNYGSAGIGSVNHVVTELFARTATIEMTHIPYRGMGEAMTGLLGGSLDVLVTAMPTAMGNVKNRMIVALGVTAPKRSDALPDVPTVTEAGASFVAYNWIGLTAPKGTPSEATDWLEKHIAAAVATAQVKDRFADQGVEATTMRSSDFAAFMQQETSRWEGVIRSAGIKIE